MADCRFELKKIPLILGVVPGPLVIVSRKGFDRGKILPECHGPDVRDVPVILLPYLDSQIPRFPLELRYS